MPLVGLQTGSWNLEVETTRAGPGPWKWPGTGEGAGAATGRGRGSASERLESGFRKGGLEVVGPKCKYICAGVAERGVGRVRLVSAKERSRVTRYGGVGLKEADGCSRYRRREDGSALDRGEEVHAALENTVREANLRINFPLEPCEAGLNVGGQRVVF